MNASTTLVPGHAAPHGPDAPDRADPGAAEAFARQVVVDLGAALHAPLVWIGDKLGLYRAMVDGDHVTAEGLARRAGTDPRMTREWLCAQAASGYVCHDPADDTFHLPPAHAAVLVSGGRSTPFALDLQGGFDVASGVFRHIDAALTAMRTGCGLPWADQHDDLTCGTDRLTRPTFERVLLDEWLSPLGRVVDRLAYGGGITLVGCGTGTAAVALSRAFPLATVHGFDDDRPTVERARATARAAGVHERCFFTQLDPEDIPHQDDDLICFFETLGRMPDPLAALARAGGAVASDGSVVVVEPIAGDAIEDNLHPVGRLLYSLSTLSSVPAAQAAGGVGLGSQIGPTSMRSLLCAAGFDHVRLAATTALHHVFEARGGA